MVKKSTYEKMNKKQICEYIDEIIANKEKEIEKIFLQINDWKKEKLRVIHGE